MVSTACGGSGGNNNGGGGNTQPTLSIASAMIDEGDAGQAQLEFTVTREADRELLLIETYREEREADGDGVGAAATAFERALADILDRFLADASSR